MPPKKLPPKPPKLPALLMSLPGEGSIAVRDTFRNNAQIPLDIEIADGDQEPAEVHLTFAEAKRMYIWLQSFLVIHNQSLD